jgi:hypothetical protein
MIKRLAAFLVLMMVIAGFAPPQQNSSGTLEMTVEAGYAGSFRQNEWLPLYIRLNNNGNAVEGRVVVRPETSNGAVNNTYSLPITLPEGARQSAFLYVTANNFARELRIEVISNSGEILLVKPVLVRAMDTGDQLHVVITQNASGTIDLTRVHDGGYAGLQANWRIDNLPDQAVGLDSINTILFSDVDTGTLSSLQRAAISDWVAQGGHLIVTGGTNWQSTASGLSELLPFIPDNSRTVSNLAPIRDWLRTNEAPLDEQTVIATGQLQSSARAMVALEDDTPLLARRIYGEGTVDYLVADPNALPLRGWDALPDFWMTLATTVDPEPGWAHGINEWEGANQAVNILPGVNLLPDILPLCGFLALYIGLIGPLNYIILNRINRREYAWITIPVLIITFSALAWFFGSNLRGTEVTISNLTVVQSWPETDRARTNAVIGLLSPRRDQYSFSAIDSGFLRPLPVTLTGGTLFGGNVQVSTTIEQTDRFRAAEFPIDASFVAAFHRESTIPAPAISGQVSLFYDGRQQVMRGSVRNDTDAPLNDPTILVQGVAERIADILEPGALKTFEVTLPGGGLPSASPIAFSGEDDLLYNYYGYGGYYNYWQSEQSVADILNEPINENDYYGYSAFPYGNTVGETTAEQERARRRLFLQALISEPYNRLTGRSDQAYLTGWTDAAPSELDFEGGSWRAMDTTLYVISLQIEAEPPPTSTVTISSDRFSWHVVERSTINDLGPVNLGLNPGDQVTFQYTPLGNAVLSEVNELSIYVDRSVNNQRTLALEVWDWAQEDWDRVSMQSSNRIRLRTPAAFLGPENAVRIRITADALGGSPQIADLSIEQRGRF